MPDPIHTPRCRARHLDAPWAIRPSYLTSAVAQIRSGVLRPRADVGDNMPEMPGQEQPEQDAPCGYQVSTAGIALVPIHGAMMKGASKYAECDTLAVRRAVRMASESRAVRGILLVIDSPGGSVPGTQELADDVYAARQVKPVHAFSDDCCCSAAYWVGCQAERLTSNALGIVGSIGVYSVVEDTSEAASMEGVRVIVVSTGEAKGALVDGVPVSDAALSEVRRLVEGTNGYFQAAVARGRPGLAGDALGAVSTGQVWMGREALALGLVDAVGTLQEAHAAVAAEADRREAVARGAEMRKIAAGSMLRSR